MKFRLYTLLILILILLASAAPAIAAPLTQPLNPEVLEAFFDQQLSTGMETHHIPGAVVVVVKGEQVIFAKGYGYADLEAQTPVDPATTLFRPGSISKLLTFTAVMQLAERGLLDLDADVNTYLDFEVPATFPEPITLERLMSHTPGFEDHAAGLFILDPAQMIPLDDYLKQNLPERVFSAGELGAYSNYGAALAGYIVERVSGQPFAEYIAARIFAPLEMHHATFQQPLPAQLAPAMAGGYNYVNGETLQGEFEIVTGVPAGALTASGLDMANFMIAHLQNGRFGAQRILHEQTALQMHSQLFTHDPRLTGMAYGFFEDSINGQRVISHEGDTILFHSGLFLIPEHNLGLFVATNGAGGEPLVKSLAQAFADQVFPIEQAALAATPDFDSRAWLYAGSYYEARSNSSGMEKFFRLVNPISVSITEDQHVKVSQAGQVTEYIEIEPGLLASLENPDERLTLRQEDGQVYLLPSNPFALIKSPWYASGRLHALILAGGALVFLLALLWLAISALLRLVKRRRARRAAPSGQPETESAASPVILQDRPLRAARWLAAGFGLGYLFFLLLFGGLFVDMNPVYGVPNFLVDTTIRLEGLLALPWLLVLLAGGMVVLTVIIWIRRLNGAWSRLAYSLLSLWAVTIVWSLAFWNLILLP